MHLLNLGYANTYQVKGSDHRSTILLLYIKHFAKPQNSTIKHYREYFMELLQYSPSTLLYMCIILASLQGQWHHFLSSVAAASHAPPREIPAHHRQTHCTPQPSTPIRSGYVHGLYRSFPIRITLTLTLVYKVNKYTLYTHCTYTPTYTHIHSEHTHR